VAKKQENACRDCKHANWVETPTGRISSIYPGRCELSLGEIRESLRKALPRCVAHPSFHKGVIWKTYTDCPAWEKK
jgi:hypothetical protein